MKLKLYMRKLQLYNQNQQPIYYDGVNPNSLQAVNGYIPNNAWREMTKYVDNIDEFSATWKVKKNLESKGISNIDKSISNELDLFDEAYKFVMAWLNDHVAAPLNAIEVRIEMENCGTIDDYVIKTDGITHCDSDKCNVQVNLKQKDDMYTCIYSTLITDNHNGMFSGLYPHPRFSYCNEFRPTFLLSLLFQAMLTIGGIMYFLSIIATVIMSIVWVITEIIDAISSLWGGDQIDTHISTPADFSHVLEGWFVDMFGCGREHPSPLIRDYISNVCSKCGIKITQDSIPIFFNPSSAYFNLTMLSAEVEKGIPKDNYSQFWIPSNDPLMTLDMLLDKLKKLFNAKWLIKNGTLYFDRYDKFEINNFLFDFIGADKDLLLDGICYTWNEDKKGAYCRIGYSADVMDETTSDCLRRYNDIVEFNLPTVNPLLEGEENRVTQDFAPTRFRNDGIDEDYVKQVLFPANDIGTAIGLVFLNVTVMFQLNWAIAKMHEYDYAILMQKHTLMLPKLIIWDGVSRVKARAVKMNAYAPIPNTAYNFLAFNYPTLNGFDNSSDSFINTSSYLQNYPMFFDAMFKGNLWDFHEIDDPRKNPPMNKNFELSIPLCCENITKLGIMNNSGGVNLERKVKLNGGTFYQEGVIKEITANFNSRNKLGRFIKIKGEL